MIIMKKMTFCLSLIFANAHQVNSDNFETTHKSNELYQIFDNRWDWELRYLHPNWSHALNPNWTVDAMMLDNQTMVYDNYDSTESAMLYVVNTSVV
jgi:hypothetical protein